MSTRGGNGGGSGIRTHDTVARIHAFQACAFSHSAIPPACAAEPMERAPGLASAPPQAGCAPARRPTDLLGSAVPANIEADAPSASRLPAANTLWASPK